MIQISNINPNHNPITTYLGMMLILVSTVIFLAPIFDKTVVAPDWYIPTGIGLLGLVLILCPDDLKGALKKLIDRKSNEI